MKLTTTEQIQVDYFPVALIESEVNLLCDWGYPLWFIKKLDCFLKYGVTFIKRIEDKNIQTVSADTVRNDIGITEFLLNLNDALFAKSVTYSSKIYQYDFIKTWR